MTPRPSSPGPPGFFSLTASLALVTGPTGTGKSCLLRLYRQALPQNRFQTVYLNLTHLNP